MTKSISIAFINTASRILKILGHPDRLKIVEFLQSEEKTVGRIQAEIGLPQPIISQHLKVMLEVGIVIYRREGTRYYYSLANKFIFKILDCLSEFQDEVKFGESNFDNSNNGRT